MKKSELKFWGCFLTLNFLLFLPRYLLEIDSSTFFPSQIFSQGDVFYSFKYLFNRENYDIFRFSIDFSFLIFLYILFKGKIRLNFAIILMSVFYIFLFFYQCYSQFFEATFNSEPFFYTDLSSLKRGFEIITAGVGMLLIIYLLLVGIVIFGLYRFVLYFLKLSQKTNLGKISRVLGFALIFVMLYSHIRYGRQQVSSMEFINISYQVTNNIARSIHTQKEMKNIDLSNLNDDYQYKKLHLKTAPNIYFIFIESYGKVVYTNKELRENYLEDAKKFDSSFFNNNFYCASTLSTSPVFGGISWVSYGSVLYGINLMDSKTFEVLADKEEFNDAVSLVKLLKNSGYKNYRLSSIKPQNNMEIPWDEYSRIYSVDRWIKFEDLNYNGKLYGFGPSPPDEYSLNFAYDFIKHDDNNGTPFTLFFITMNSHNPFYSPEISNTGWKDLNNNPEERVQKSVFLKKPQIANYGNSINYQLSYLTKFIIQNGGNDIFILIGDHQPPAIAKSSEGFETPVHIISRDSTFIDGFIKYGFNHNLKIKDLNKSVRHEGLYTIFLREFIQNYTANLTVLPDYLPEGISIKRQ